MKKDFLKKLESLLSKGKKEEARALLRLALAAPLTDEERGAILVGFAAAYLALSNSVTETHNAIMTQEIEDLERFSTLERDLDEKLRLARVRSQLQS